jgi:hypothetical protein
MGIGLTPGLLNDVIHISSWTAAGISEILMDGRVRQKLAYTRWGKRIRRDRLYHREFRSCLFLAKRTILSCLFRSPGKSLVFFGEKQCFQVCDGVSPVVLLYKQLLLHQRHHCGFDARRMPEVRQIEVGVNVNEAWNFHCQRVCYSWRNLEIGTLGSLLKLGLLGRIGFERSSAASFPNAGIVFQSRQVVLTQREWSRRQSAFRHDRIARTSMTHR